MPEVLEGQKQYLRAPLIVIEPVGKLGGGGRPAPEFLEQAQLDARSYSQQLLPFGWYESLQAFRR
jgi:hypothetical protein